MSVELKGNSDSASVSEQVFRAAVELVQNMPKDGDVNLSNNEKLEFYALFKQATLGPCTSNKPSLWNVVERYKWDAWSALGSLEPEKARTQYVHKLKTVMGKVFETRTVQELLADPRWQPIRPVVEPKFEILGGSLGLTTPSQLSEPCSSSSADQEEGTASTLELVYNDITTQPGSNRMSEDEYLDARGDSPVIVDRKDLNLAPDDPTSRSLTAELLSTFQTTSRLISQQVQILSAAFQQQNSVIQTYLDKMVRHRALSWPLLILIFIWPVIVQLVIRHFLRQP